MMNLLWCDKNTTKKNTPGVLGEKTLQIYDDRLISICTNDKEMCASINIFKYFQSNKSFVSKININNLSY